MNTNWYEASARARAHVGSSSCAVAPIVDCTATQLSPASTSAATTTARDGCTPTTATAAAYRRVAPVTSRPAPHDARSGGSTAVPMSAPSPTAASNPPYPLAPRCSGPRATAGNSAQRPLAEIMNSAERARRPPNAGALRTYRIPARMACPIGSAPSARTGGARGQRYRTASTPRKDTAFRANAAAGPAAAMSSPPTAGPTARATLALAPFSRAARGQLVAVHQLGLDRLEAGSCQRLAHRQHRGQDEQPVRRHRMGRGRRGQRGGGQQHQGLGDQQQAPPVDHVAQRAGGGDEEQFRQRRSRLHEGDLQRGPAEVAHQPLRTDRLRPGSRVRDELGGPQRAEPGPPQGCPGRRDRAPGGLRGGRGPADVGDVDHPRALPVSPALTRPGAVPSLPAPSVPPERLLQPPRRLLPAHLGVDEQRGRAGA